jgi:hypothetical protein
MRFLRPASICLIVGVGLFVAGFFLPAVRFPPDPPTGAQWNPGPYIHDVEGWLCAEASLMASADLLHGPQVQALNLALSGWINPLAVLYLLAWAVKGFRRVRPWIAASVVVCCVAMWIGLRAEHVTLLIGHYLWIAGIF